MTTDNYRRTRTRVNPSMRLRDKGVDMLPFFFCMRRTSQQQPTQDGPLCKPSRGHSCRNRTTHYIDSTQGQVHLSLDMSVGTEVETTDTPKFHLHVKHGVYPGPDNACEMLIFVSQRSRQTRYLPTVVIQTPIGLYECKDLILKYIKTSSVI